MSSAGVSRPLRAVVLIDGLQLPSWAIDATLACINNGTINIIGVLLCENNKPSKKIWKYFLYYLIRILFIRPSAWKLRGLSEIVSPSVPTIKFSADLDGSWQKIPEWVSETARGLEIDVVLKFGMGLLRDPQIFPSRFGVISYHHGDPASYRGRPAGFYEVLHRAFNVGAVVQRLTNVLDGGEFLASASFRIEPHSYQATLQSLYSGSTYLLDKALRNCGSNVERSISVGELGFNYRLPSNRLVMEFIFRIAGRKLSRLVYGGFFRKSWRLFEVDRDALLDFHGDRKLVVSQLPMPTDTDFLADPFYLGPTGDCIVCERMPSGSVSGEIVKIRQGERYYDSLLADQGRHFSYPYVLNVSGRSFLVPEVADWSSPTIVEIDPLTFVPVSRQKLIGLERERLLDSTIVQYNGKFWLFGTPQSRFRKSDTLLLWSAHDLKGPYLPHPMNPVVLDPSGARSGGAIVVNGDGRIFRFAQDNSRDYGDGLNIFEVETLNEQVFSQTLVGRVSLLGWRGPHTIDFSKNKVILDGYRDVFDVFAGVKRFVSIVKSFYND